MLDNNKDDLVVRLKELEERIEQLRLSRRVLMNLLESMEKEKRLEVNKIRAQQTKLKKANVRYAYNLLQQNAKVLELEKKLHP